MLSRLLDKVARWALSKNPSGGYSGEDDKRWAYVIETDGSPYLTRVLLPKIFGLRPMLHHFHRPDSDRNLHNHPWAWAFSLILSGSYNEERLVDSDVCEETRSVGRVRWWNKLTSKDYHAVTQLHGDVWTLFITGKHVQDWGFMVDGRHVPWRQYLGVKE